MTRPHFNNFDVVVVDEASMLILPNAAYVASLSKDKVIFAGDFRQIPPIINDQDNEVVKRWVGRSIFDEVNPERKANSDASLARHNTRSFRK